MVRKLARFPRTLTCLFVAGFISAAAAYDASADRLGHTVKLDRSSIEVIDADGTSDINVRAREFDRMAEPGMPALPYKVVSFLLPQGHGVDSYSFDASEPLPIASRHKLRSADPMLSEKGELGMGIGMVRAGEDGTFPSVYGRYLGTGYLHGRAIASFAVFPVRSIGTDASLSETVRVSVSTSPTDMSGVAVRQRHREGFDTRLEKILEGVVVNPEMARRYDFNETRVEKQRGGFQPTSYPSLEGSPVDYLIITTDALKSEFQRLADFKTAKGVPTVVKTLTEIQASSKNGVDMQETMRFYIRDAYERWGITYLLLGGDTDTMPPRIALSRFYLGGTELPVDMYFSCLDGTWNDNHDRFWGEGAQIQPLDNPDIWAEVYQGRIPISELSELTPFIDKIIAYESAVNPGYLDQYLFLAEVLFPVPWSDPEPISLNGADFAEFIVATALLSSSMTLTKMYETPSLYSGAVQENVSAAIAALNAGYNHVNHVGHGFRFNMSVANGSILTDDADGLTNTGQPFNLYMLNCTAAAFDFFCLAEHFLQNDNAGAVSVVGAAQSAFPNASSNYMNEYHSLVFDDDVVHVGEALARSRLPRTPVADMGDNVDLWTHYIYAILADPEMPFFTGAVSTPTVTHVPTVNLGTTSILVNVTANAQPVDSALVCLSKDDEDYISGATNSLGNVILDFTAESPGSIQVVVTGLNLARSTTYIEVLPESGAYVSFNDLTVDDDGAGGSVGNGDGIVDAGETIDFAIEVRNTGGTTANNVSLTLSSSDPNVTILDATAVVGTVNAGGTAVATDPVRVQFDAGTIDESAVEFDLQVTDGVDTWDDTFRKVVHAPDLHLISLRIDDTTLGNGDGIIQNGENFLLFTGFKNYGTGTASGLSGVITDPGTAFAIVNGNDTYPDITPLTSQENNAGYHLAEGNTATENDLILTITDSFLRTHIDTIELRVPDPPDSLEFDTSLGPDRLRLYWKQSTSIDVAYYNVYRSGTPGGPYTQVNVDPIGHAVYEDTGLMETTTYYYVISAVDDEGNESQVSAEFFGSTNPAQMSGFPIQMGGQTPSSPAMGDIDGDGDIEIVVGSDRVHAWHADGQEILDGDGDPQSWGVINDLGDEFAAPVALANIDANPGFEIVAADLFGKNVYVLDHMGVVLPGWPKASLDGFRASPVVGDLDGDFLPEIVAINQVGVIYAWHADGQEVRDGDNDPLTDGVFFVTAPAFSHYMAPALCDVDGDGKDEIIQGTRGGLVHVLNDDGSEVPGWPFALSGEAAGAPVVGDIDNDGQQEIVVRSKATDFYVLNHDGSVAAGWPRFIAINDVFFAYSTMALADVDNDNTLEIAATYHSVSTTRLYLLEHNGADYPGWPLTISTDDIYTESQPTIADLDGDGMVDIMIGDESKLIYAFDLTGGLIAGFPIATKDAIRATPHLADADQDGDIDMVLHSWDQNIYLYDLPAPWVEENAPWPTFQGNVNRTGQYNEFVASAAAGAAFSFVTTQNGVELNWLMGDDDPASYRLERATVVDDNAGGFAVLAAGLRPQDGGRLTYRDGAAQMGETYVYRLAAIDNPRDVFETDRIYVPVSRAELDQNFPNPFNPTTTIQYFVPEGAGAQRVSLVIYDVSGARVRTLVDTDQRSGKFTVTWDGRNNAGDSVGSGVYFYRIQLPGFADTKKMILLK